MKRNKFLKSIGGLIGLGVIAPTVIAGLIEKKTTQNIGENNVVLDHKTFKYNYYNDNKELNNDFFKYLETNDVGFKWEKLELPIFRLDENNNVIYFDQTKKTYCVKMINGARYRPEIKMTEYSKDVENKLRNEIFKNCCESIKNLRKEKYFIYDLQTSITSYDRDYINPSRIVNIRLYYV